MESTAGGLVLMHAPVVHSDAGNLGPLRVVLQPPVISPELPGASCQRSLTIQRPIIEKLFFRVRLGTVQPSEAPAVPFEVVGQHANVIHICGSACAGFFLPRVAPRSA